MLDPSALLGGGGAAPDPSQGGGGGGQPGAPDNPDAESDLSDAIAALHSFLQNEQDDADKSVASACLAKLQSILGNRQKAEESAAGITPAHKAMSRAYGG